MKTQINFVLITFGFVFFASACNTGVKFVDNCNNPKRIKVVVLPFKGDNYNCDNNLEELLRRKCYEVEDGKLLVVECSIALHKSESELTIEELVTFAASRGIDKIVYGVVNYEWTDVFYIDKIESDKINKMIEGNYAILNGYCIDTKTHETTQTIFNYRVKKIRLGMPEMMRVILE